MWQDIGLGSIAFVVLFAMWVIGQKLDDISKKLEMSNKILWEMQETLKSNLSSTHFISENMLAVRRKLPPRHELDERNGEFTIID